MSTLHNLGAGLAGPRRRIGPRARGWPVLALRGVVCSTWLWAATPVMADLPLQPDTMAARVAACTLCHGPAGGAGSDGYYPRIAGKPAGYLLHQLQYFRDGLRVYAPMARLLHGLSDDYLREMAVYFEQQRPAYPPAAAPTEPGAVLQRGRELTLQGDAARGVPACVACHGEALGGVTPAVPGLLGLPRDYLSAQIGAWRSGLRQAMAPDCMGDIARRMRPEDVVAVSAWLAALPAGQAQPVASLPSPLPMACGGVPQPTAEGRP